MNDPLERLEAALRASTPHAPPAVRTQAMGAALAAFDAHHQGNGAHARHTERVPEIGTALRRMIMQIARPKRALAATAACAVALVGGIAGYHTWQDRRDTTMTDVIAGYHTSQEARGTTRTDVIASESNTKSAARSAASRNTPLSANVAPQASMTLSAPLGMRVEGDTMRHAAISPAEGPWPEPAPGAAPQGGDRFERHAANPVKRTAEHPVSTFSIDVDTASYAFVRAMLNQGVLPPPEAVRPEEMVNYFPYDYAGPGEGDVPFAVHTTVLPAPWRDGAQLLHIGIKGYTAPREEAPAANLVFLVDTSGSMAQPNKLPLLTRALKLALAALGPDDTVGLVAYAGSAGVVLEPTPASERETIASALDRLQAGGGTAGQAGLAAAYALAEAHAIEGGANRVILATDGDFNVGVSDPDGLEGYIARKRAGGVSLSVLGFGTGNYNDALMQRLAQNGDGNAAYIDSLAEARKVLLEEAASTLVTIAKDVKIQVEFNPAAVREYRLIGYESRQLAREDFRNDKVDAGEIGAGHSVTALYELTPAGASEETAQIGTLRYADAPAPQGDASELAFVKIRYKPPGEDASRLLTTVVRTDSAHASLDESPGEARFASAVAAFAEQLRGARHTGTFSLADTAALAAGARGDDPFGYRNEMVRLVRLAEAIQASE